MLENLIDPRAIVAQSKIAGLNPQRLAHAKKRIEHQFLRHHAKQLPGTSIIGAHIMTHDPGLPAVHPAKAGQYADQGRLARAIGPQQSEEFALLDRQINPVKGAQGAKALCQSLYPNRCLHRL